MISKKTLHIPADVPEHKTQEFINNYSAITKGSDRVMLFACDQKMEHLNADFYGPDISPDALNPEHIFTIADQGTIGALATHVGLIARYGRQYPSIAYIAKLNGKTDAISVTHHEPLSQQLWTVQDVMQLKETGMHIIGIGLTVYIGSEYESEMLAQAAQSIVEAHQHGLLAIIWMYPRGKAINDDQEAHLIAGACGLAATLGADIVKIKPPRETAQKSSEQWLRIATTAAGNTKVICAGGEQKKPIDFLETLHKQLHEGGIAGSATGRNIFQKSLPEAIAFTKAIAALVYENKSVEQALTYLK